MSMPALSRHLLRVETPTVLVRLPVLIARIWAGAIFLHFLVISLQSAFCDGRIVRAAGNAERERNGAD